MGLDGMYEYSNGTVVEGRWEWNEIVEVYKTYQKETSFLSKWSLVIKFYDS